MAAAQSEFEPIVGVAPACKLTGISRATRYRQQSPPVEGPPKPRPTPTNALTAEERAEVLALLLSPRYRDLVVAQVWAMILDDGRNLCSISSMHRILREVDEAGDRRRQRTHPAKVKPTSSPAARAKCRPGTSRNCRAPNVASTTACTR
jgi:putative transposase